MKYLFVILIVIFDNIEGKLLPTYIKACSREDPNLNECFMENGNKALKYIAKGDPEFNMEPLYSLKWEDPLYIETPTNPPFNLLLTNITIYGLENMEITKPNIDLNERKLQFTLTNPLIVWKEDYKASVKIDNVTHEVEGKGEIEFEDGGYVLTWNYDFYLDKGVKYAMITNYSVEFLNDEINFNFENFDNKVINSTWKNAKQYFANEIVLDRCAWTGTSYINDIFKNVPFDFVFTP